MKKLVIIIITLCFGLLAQAQTAEKIAFNRGVYAYQKGEYAKATESFKKAYDLNSDYLKALYNAGNSAYLNGDFEDAKQLFSDYTRFADSRIDKAKAHYNIGNIALQNGKSIEKELMQVSKDQTVSYDEKMKLFDTSQDEYKAAIKSYKESLRNNSSDEDVKYNLTYALKHLKYLEQQQEQEQKEGDSDKKDQQEENQEKEDKGNQSDEQKDGDQSDDGNPKDGDKKDGDQKGKDDSEKDGDPSKKEGDKDKEGKDNDSDPKEGKNGEEEKEIEGQISKAQARKELDAMNNDEQKVLMKVFKSKEDKKKQTNSKKDW